MRRPRASLLPERRPPNPCGRPSGRSLVAAVGSAARPARGTVRGLLGPQRQVHLPRRGLGIAGSEGFQAWNAAALPWPMAPPGGHFRLGGLPASASCKGTPVTPLVPVPTHSVPVPRGSRKNYTPPLQLAGTFISAICSGLRFLICAVRTALSGPRVLSGKGPGCWAEGGQEARLSGPSKPLPPPVQPCLPPQPCCERTPVST